MINIALQIQLEQRFMKAKEMCIVEKVVRSRTQQ